MELERVTACFARRRNPAEAAVAKAAATASDVVHHDRGGLPRRSELTGCTMTRHHPTPSRDWHHSDVARDVVREDIGPRGRSPSWSFAVDESVRHARTASRSE